MAPNGTKLSFAFNAAGPSTGRPAPPPLSNMEKLLAQAKSAKKPSKPALPFGDNDDEEGSGLALPKAAASSSRLVRRPPVLLDDPDDDDDDAAPTSLPVTTTTKPTAMPRAALKAQQQALSLDSTVFDYDSHYDNMKAAERKREEAKRSEDAGRKPKFIEGFLASAQTRKLDRFRAEEKMMQREREKEGEEFADKDKFVTEGYKKQMEEVRKAEEEEKRREEALRKSNKGPGLSEFYKAMLEDDEAKHAAAMSATAHGNAGPSLAIRPPSAKQAEEEYEPEAEYDPFLAREAGSTKVDNATGKQVEINDDGEVVDKRSLLKAGLNIMKKPKAPEVDPSSSSLLHGQQDDKPYKSRAVGTAASYTERMERERRRLAEQVKEEEARKRRDREERQRQAEEEARKRREGDDGEAERRRQEARQRFLDRKRKKVEGKGEGDEGAQEEKRVKVA